MTSISDIPAEIVSNILSRLPARSVLSCQCVCKTFDALIKTPDFIATHVNRTTSVATATLCTIYYGTHERTTDHILVDNTKGDNSLSSLKPRNPIAIANAIADGDMVCLVDSCNGLFCAHFCYETEGPDILLWNPVTKQNRFLPKPQIDNSSEVVLAFGFVPETKDYKVVQIASYPLKPPKIQVYKMSTDSWSIIDNTTPTLSGSVPNHVEFEVYSLSCGKWTVMETSLNDVYMDVNPISRIHIRGPCYSSPVPLKGAFHFLAVVPLPIYPNYEDQSFIAVVSFDLKDEQLRLIDVLGFDMVPHSLKGITFGVLNESLMLVSTKYHACVIWVMNEYGIHESWTKQFSFTEFPKSLWPMEYWKDNILLMAETLHDQRRLHDFRRLPTLHDFRRLPTLHDKRRLSLYNLYTRERKSLAVQGCFDCLTLSSYIETFVPVSQGNSIAEEADR